MPGRPRTMAVRVARLVERFEQCADALCACCPVETVGKTLDVRPADPLALAWKDAVLAVEGALKALECLRDALRAKAERHEARLAVFRRALDAEPVSSADPADGNARGADELSTAPPIPSPDSAPIATVSCAASDLLRPPTAPIPNRSPRKTK